jgi:hypothetical protein
MESTCTFGSKMSVSAFKAKHNADRIDIVRNPKNSKLFVSANGVTIASVSKNYDSAKDKEFVELVLPDSSILWCLHNPSDTNVVESL